MSDEKTSSPDTERSDVYGLPSEHNVVTVMKRTEGPGNLKTRVRRGGGRAEGQVGDTQLCQAHQVHSAI